MRIVAVDGRAFHARLDHLYALTDNLYDDDPNDVQVRLPGPIHSMERLIRDQNVTIDVSGDSCNIHWLVSPAVSFRPPFFWPDEKNPFIFLLLIASNRPTFSALLDSNSGIWGDNDC